MYSLWQDLSVDTKIFDFVTLTLNFDLLLKKLNLGHNFWNKRDRAFIFYMCISCDKTFLSIPKFSNLWPWPWLQTYFWKTLNLGHNFWTKRDRAFIFHMCISCGKTFLLIPKFLTSWPWPWLLTYFWKNLTLAITFEPKEMGLSYFTCVFLVGRPFCRYQYFWPSGLDLDFDLLLEKLKLVAAGGISPVRTDPDLVWYFFYCVACES